MIATSSSKASIRSSSSSVTAHQVYENREIAEWLSPNNFRETQKVILHSRAQGTGLELIQSKSYMQWRDGDIKLLWMSGLPATGKTMTAAGVVNDLDEYYKGSNVAVICAFFDFRQNRTQNTQSLLLAMLRQLVEAHPTVPPIVASLYASHSYQSSFPRFDEIVATFSAVAQGFDRTFVIVDAVDECLDDHTRSYLTYTLSSLSVSLLFTSRPDPSVGKILENWTRLDLHASQHDLRLYAEERFQLSRLAQTCGVESKQKILEQVVQKADGMFIVARLHLDALMNVSGTKEALELLQNVPVGVERTYEKTMQRISKASDSKCMSLALCSLLWITFSRRILVLSELQEVIAIMINPKLNNSQKLARGLPEKESIISACAGLIEIDENTMELRLIHYTAHEYIVREKSRLWSNVQHCMAVACLSYLRCILPSIDCGSGVFIEEAILSATQLHPFVSYAVREWGYHVHDCEKPKLANDVIALLACDKQDNLSRMLTFDVMRSPKCTSWSAIHLCAYFDLSATCLQMIKLHGAPIKQVSWFLRSFSKHPASHPMISLDAQDAYDRSPLMVAASQGSIEVVRVLLNHHKHINVDMKDYHLRTPLSHAAERGSLEVARLLLKHCSTTTSITSRDIFGRTVLFYAVESRCVDLVSLLLDQEGMEINAEDNHGRTPLSYAAQHGYSDIVGILLKEEGIEVNRRDPKGFTPLLYASMEGHEDVARLLLERKEIMINCVNSDGRSPLSLAAQRGHEEVVSLLLNSPEVEANLKDFQTGRTPLSYSAQSGTIQITRSLLSRKDVLVDSKDNSGRTSLFYAVEQTDGAEMVLLLLDAGADHNCMDIRERTPLAYATERKNRKVVDLLLACPMISLKIQAYGRSLLSNAVAYGWTDLVQYLMGHPDIDPNSKDHEGMDALGYAAREGRNDIVRLLLSQKDVDVNSLDKQGRTALSHAASSGHEPVVKFLVSLPEALHNWSDYSGRSPLHHAALNGHSEVIQTLLTVDGMNINSTDHWGMTPIMHAASSGLFEAVRLFLSRQDIEVWGLDNRQQTIITHVAQRSHLEILDLLLSYNGATSIVDLKDDNGRTPLSYAAQNGNVDIVKRLLQCPEVDPNSRDHLNSVTEYAAEALAEGRGGGKARKSYATILAMLFALTRKST